MPSTNVRRVISLLSSHFPILPLPQLPYQLWLLFFPSSLVPPPSSASPQHVSGGVTPDVGQVTAAIFNPIFIFCLTLSFSVFEWREESFEMRLVKEVRSYRKFPFIDSSELRAFTSSCPHPLCKAAQDHIPAGAARGCVRAATPASLDPSPTARKSPGTGGPSVVTCGFCLPSDSSRASI
ncbi:hypothetical protein E2C01_077478 [Portunus trituberculatus]|uniref:Uncharacterized protein n=1 Tax=Portunus trituberculatus TaxID=210409 RepID=A0A5B7IKD4_PORTR|nr:hypothetical protein [Portunus trituberculatus]